jgi:superfamily I DNA/RNA helicase
MEIHPPHPINNKTLEILRGVLNPYAKVPDREGRDIGTATHQQEALITESLPAAEPQQLGLFQDDPLSKEAYSVVQNHTVRLVRGVAGSGKTLVLMNRALYLQQRYPHSRILVMTFNRDLAAHLQKRAPSLEILNFHKLCADIIGKAWHSPQYPSGWLQRYALSEIRQLGLPYTDEYEMVRYVEEEIGWRKDLDMFDQATYLAAERRGRTIALDKDKRKLLDKIFQRYWQYQTEQRNRNGDWMDWNDVPIQAHHVLEEVKHPLKHSYDIILVDEGQDFAPTWFRVIQLLLKPNGSLFICDDPTQSLFRYFSWREKGVEVMGRSRILRVPFRCTRKINEAAYSLVLADELLSNSEEIIHPDLTSPELIEGSLPALYAFDTPEQERQTIKDEVQTLLENGNDPQDIAVLCHHKGLVKHYADLRNLGIYVEHFEKMKGLEFIAVFIPEVHSAFDNMTDQQAISQMRRRMFTAMTRARQVLTLSYHKSLPDALKPIVPHVYRQKF